MDSDRSSSVISEQLQSDRIPIHHKKKQSSTVRNPWIGFLLRFIVNKHVSLKSQLIITFTLTSVISGGVAVMICLLLLYSLAFSTKRLAAKTITNNALQNVKSLSEGITSAVTQQFLEVGQSICLTSALYSRTLLQHAEDIHASNSTLLAPQKSYREYNFNSPSCSAPNCPSDFGPIYTRSRLPYIAGFEYGSLLHSSVYLYSSQLKSSIRNDTSWNSTFSTYSALQNVLDALSVQDIDYYTMYTQGPNSTVMFYLSAQIVTDKASGDYFSLHRTFPGIFKDSSTYNPPGRPWFSNAEQNKINIYGPYKETFTEQLSITLSSKMSTTLKSGETVHTVSAAVLAIDEIANIMNSVSYIYNGFAALISVNDSKVLVWGNNPDVYDYGTNTFRNISYFDDILATFDLSYEHELQYKDYTKTQWIVYCSPLFSESRTTGTSLVLLVFANQHEARTPLKYLKAEIANTTVKITFNISAIVLTIYAFVMIMVIILATFIIHPLEIMRNMSRDLVKVTARGGNAKDYSAVMSRAKFDLHRKDEVGILAANYFHILCLLQIRREERRNVKKYPKNPFHLKCFNNFDELTWDEAYPLINSEHESLKSNTSSAVVSITYDSNKKDMISLFSGFLNWRNKFNTVAPAPVNVSSANDSDDLEDGQNLKLYPIKENPECKGQCTTVTTSKPRKCLGSLSSQLYFLMAFIVAGIIAPMIMTVLLLVHEGRNWTALSKIWMEQNQIQSLEAMAIAKAIFVQVRIF